MPRGDLMLTSISELGDNQNDKKIDKEGVEDVVNATLRAANTVPMSMASPSSGPSPQSASLPPVLFQLSSERSPKKKPLTKCASRVILPALATSRRRSVTSSALDDDDKSGNWANMVGRVRNADPEDHISTTHGTIMRRPKGFGIGKNGVSRAIMRFSRPPEDYPLTLCFNFPSVFLTHNDVLKSIKIRLYPIPDAKVISLQFHDRNTLLGTQALDNRWMITLNSVKARDELQRIGLHMYNRKIVLRKYDDIVQEEYNEFLRYEETKNKLLSKKEADVESGTGSQEGNVTTGELSNPPAQPKKGNGQFPTDKR